MFGGIFLVSPSKSLVIPKVEAPLIQLNLLCKFVADLNCGFSFTEPIPPPDGYAVDTFVLVIYVVPI